MMCNVIIHRGLPITTRYSIKRKMPGWTAERRAAFEARPKREISEEQRKAMSERMKQIRREKYWNSKGKSKQSQQP